MTRWIWYSLLGLIALVGYWDGIDCIMGSMENQKSIPVYFINLESNTARRSYMESHLTEIGFSSFHRINALTPKTCNLLLLESSCSKRVGFHEIAILCSHLYTWYYAAFLDPKRLQRKGDFILVLEDDIKFVFDFKYDLMLPYLPNNTGIVQLMYSHVDHIEPLWDVYSSTCPGPQFSNKCQLFLPRHRNSSVWSAQAYLLNITMMSTIISNIVSFDRKGKIGFKVAGKFDFRVPNPINRFKPGVSSYCIFSDMYLYSLAQPAYFFTFPILNGAGVGSNSSSHQLHVPFHIHGFALIEKIHRLVLDNKMPMPPFISPLPSVSIDSEMNWTHIALTTSLPSYYRKKAIKDFSG